MSHDSSAEHTPHPGAEGAAATGTPAAPNPFSPAEIVELRREDRGAAKTIVGLMLGIFTLGLVGYILVAFWVME